MEITHDNGVPVARTERWMRERGLWVPDTRDDDTREHDAFDVSTITLAFPQSTHATGYGLSL